MIAKCRESVDIGSGCRYIVYMTSATTTEKQALTELVYLFDEAKGDHDILASVRAQISAEIDALVASLAAAGVDTDALLDEVYA